jgi:hypothetical protein
MNTLNIQWQIVKSEMDYGLYPTRDRLQSVKAVKTKSRDLKWKEWKENIKEVPVKSIPNSVFIREN